MITRLGLSGLSSASRLSRSSCSISLLTKPSIRGLLSSTSHRPFTLLRQSSPTLNTYNASSRIHFRTFSSASERLSNLRVTLRRGILAFSRTNRTAQRPRAWQSSGGRGWGRTSWFRDPNRVVPSLIAINVLVTFLWMYAEYSWERFKDPSLLIWMQQNMTLSDQTMRAGRIWTLLTSAFSHTNITHLFVNGLGLYFITPIILQTTAMLVSPRRVLPVFWAVYLGGALASSFAVLSGRRSFVPTSGASGALYSMLGYQVMLAPTMPVQLYFFIPMQLRLLVAGVTVWELYELLYRPASNSSSEGHLGGLAFGLVAGLFMRRYTGFTPRF